jgi:hypothetical protein
MIVDDVYKFKRGIIVEIKNSFTVPAIGEIYSCGIDSWSIIGVEKVRTGCFNDHSNAPFNNAYLVLLKPVNESKPPMRGYILSKTI